MRPEPSHLGVTKDRGPFAEVEICGDHDAGAFVEFTEQMEQQRPARGAEWQIPELVQDHHVQAGHAFGNLPSLTLGLFLLKGIDQFDGGEEPDLAAVMFYSLDTESCCDMCLSGARAPIRTTF